MLIRTLYWHEERLRLLYDNVLADSALQFRSALHHLEQYGLEKYLSASTCRYVGELRRRLHLIEAELERRSRL